MRNRTEITDFQISESNLPMSSPFGNRRLSRSIFPSVILDYKSVGKAHVRLYRSPQKEKSTGCESDIQNLCLKCVVDLKQLLSLIHGYSGPYSMPPVKSDIPIQSRRWETTTPIFHKLQPNTPNFLHNCHRGGPLIDVE